MNEIVKCLHCREVYKSNEIRFVKGYWLCKYEDCDGGGLDIDILPMYKFYPRSSGRSEKQFNNFLINFQY